MKAEISFSMLVKLIIVLLIFIILLLIFTGRVGDFMGGVFSCDSRGGSCVDKPENCPGKVSQLNCPTEDYNVCCLPEVG